MTRHYSSVDRLLGVLDEGLATLFGPAPRASRPSPAAGLEETGLDADARRSAAGLMRVDHAGEICAQALYQGQALTARLDEVRDKMEQAAREENDHLAWTEERLGELDSHTSRLNPLWYAGSFAIGALAGIAGDRWSLGFVAETERQVVAHIDSHLQTLPAEDAKSRAILEQMRIDENQHATSAIKAGGRELPAPVRTLMRLTARIMTATARHV